MAYSYAIRSATRTIQEITLNVDYGRSHLWPHSHSDRPR